MAAQINQALDNVEAVLRESGASLSAVVRLTCYTTDVLAATAAEALGCIGRAVSSASVTRSCVMPAALCMRSECAAP